MRKANNIVFKFSFSAVFMKSRRLSEGTTVMNEGSCDFIQTVVRESRDMQHLGKFVFFFHCPY